MKKYYLHNGTEQQGPFDIEELKTKNITKDTLFWHEGLSDWTTRDKIDELKDLLKTTTPPPFGTMQTPPPIKKPQPQQTPYPNSSKKKKMIIYSLIGVGIFCLIGGSILYYQYSRQQKEKQLQDDFDRRRQEEINIQKAKEEAAYQERERNVNQKQNEEVEKQQQVESAKERIRNNWSDYIKVERSSYTYREAGGIFDMYITVTNETDYTMDNVTTEISYIKANGEIYKTPAIYFTGIAPHYWSRKKAPDSDRGIRVDYLKITSIKSNGLNLCYEQGIRTNNKRDPYKCN